MTWLALIDQFKNHENFQTQEVNHKDIWCISDINSLSKLFSESKPDIVINCIAYNNVNDCEVNYDIAFRTNAIWPLNLAKLSNIHWYKLIHYSTSYVFDGKKWVPYIESDIPNPLNVYASTKYLWELFVQNYCDNYNIIRITWLYSMNPSRTKWTNFFLSIINKSNTSDTIQMVDDEVITPTYIDEIANNTITLVNKDLKWIFHMMSEWYCSWYEFTAEVYRLLHIKTKIIPIKSNIWAIKRPLFSVLSNSELTKNGINQMSNWKVELKFFIDKEYGNIQKLITKKQARF